MLNFSYILDKQHWLNFWKCVLIVTLCCFCLWNMLGSVGELKCSKTGILYVIKYYIKFNILCVGKY